MTNKPRFTAQFQRPFKEQIDFFRRKLNLPSERYDDIEKAAHDRAFIVAGAQKADLVNDLHRAVEDRIRAGEGLDEFRRDFRQIVEKHGWTGWTGEGTAKGEAWRTRVIYETNLRTSYAAGRYQQLTNPNLLKVAPFWQYIHSGAEHARKEHKAWGDAKLTLPHDHPFWKTNYPPNGYHCGCTVTAVVVPRSGAAITPPEGWDVPDPQTGMPPGVDPGWDYAPGAKAATPMLDLVGKKLFNLDAPIGAQMWSALGPAIEMEQTLAVKDMVDAVVKTKTAKNAAVLVGAMTEEIVTRLVALGHAPETADLWLRDADLLHALRDSKQDRLATLPLDAWRSLPARIREAKPWFDTTDPALIYVFDAGGNVGKVAIRVNYREKIRDAGGKRQHIRSNFVRTGGIVDASNVEEPNYKPLF